MTDIWVCSNCASVNRQRSSSCYKCGAPQTDATGAMAEHRVVEAVANRSVRRYRGSTLIFLVASALVLAVATLGLVILLDSLRDVDAIRSALVTAIQTRTPSGEALAAGADRLAGAEQLHLVLLLAAVVAFGAWLSRVVSNIPTLGGGIPATSPTRAFIYPCIPLWNLIKVPGIMQDVLYRLDPKAGGFFMILIAWFGLVGSWFVSLIGGWVIAFVGVRDVTVAAQARSTDAIVAAAVRAFDQLIALEVVTALMVAGGAAVLVLVMARIERRAKARDAEIRAAAAAAFGTGAAGVAESASGEGMPGTV